MTSPLLTSSTPGATAKRTFIGSAPGPSTLAAAPSCVQVMLQRRHGPVGVAGVERRDDRGVLRDQLSWPSGIGGDHRGGDALLAVAQAVVELEQDPVPGGHDPDAMELAVGRRETRQVALREQLTLTRELCLERLWKVRLSGGCAQAVTLDQQSRLEDLAHLACGDWRHEGATLGIQREQPLTLELQQRLTYRGAADAQLVSDRALAQELTVAVDAVEQALLDVPVSTRSCRLTSGRGLWWI